jgi:hypothetical protein
MKSSTLIMALLLATLAVAVTTPQSPFHLTGASLAGENANFTLSSAPSKSCLSGARYSTYYRQCVRSAVNTVD